MTNHNDVIYNIQVNDEEERIQVIQSGANGPGAPIKTVNGATGVVVLDTDDISEGLTNLYYTDTRVKNTLSASGDLSYNSLTGEFSVTTYKSTDFDTDFSNKSTTDLTEGTNLYYTEARVNTNIASKTTDDLSEGLTNKYYTNTRARNALSASGDLSYNSITGEFSVTTYKSTDFDTDFTSKSTTDLTEGTNLYYTDARAQAAISGGTGVNVTTGTVSIGQSVGIADNVTFNNLVLDGDLTVNGTTTTVNSTQVDIADNIIILNSGETGTPTQNSGFEIERGTGTNVKLIWNETTDQWSVGTEDFVANNFIGNLTGNVTGQVTDISNHTTTDLTEGTNLYYTNTRANSAIDTRVNKTFVDNLNVDADTLDGQHGVYYLNYTNMNNKPFIPSTTTDISEGTNLYYTAARANAAIDGRVTKNYVNLLNVDSDTLDGQHGAYYLDYTNMNNKPFIPSTTTDIGEGTNLYFTNERVDDRVAGLLTAGAGIAITYNDVANTLTVESLVSGYGSADFDADFAANTTDDLSEGITNKYFTNERVDDRVAGLLVGGNNITVAYDDVANTLTINGQPGYTTTNFTTDFATKTTTDLTEGTNLYYTDARANSAIDARVNKAYVDLLNVDADTLDGQHGAYYLDYTNFTNVPETSSVENSDTPPSAANDGDLWFSTDTGNFFVYYSDVDSSQWVQVGGVSAAETINNTDDVAEGTVNKYYTDARVNSVIATKTTDDISEGITNKYYTDAKVDARIDLKSTTDISEGTNLYYTNERVDDRVSNLLVAGSGITLTYNDGAGTLTVDSAGSSVPNSTSTTVGGLTSRYDAASNTLYLRNDGGTA